MLCAQRSRKRTIILSFELRRRSLSNVKIMFFFTIPLVEHSSWWSVRSTKKMQSRVNFPDFSFTCSYIAKVTPPPLRGVSLRTFVLICYLEVTFHVKHCKSKLKIVYIIPVRIKKRKIKKRGNIPLSATHDFIPIFFIFFISKFSLYMIFRFLQFSCTK